MSQTRIAAPDVYLDRSLHHERGVFAGRAYAAGEVVETSPVVVFAAEELPHVDETALYGHYFEWADGGGALALGFGSMYNHSYAPNARYETDWDEGLVTFSALVDVAVGDELLINYNGDPESRAPLWFDA